MTQPDIEVEAAGGVVVDDTGRIAIIHRPRRNDWSLPKGHVDPGETHEEAALREVVEETGLTCRIIGDAGETRYTDRNGRHKRVRYYVMSVLGGAFEPNHEASAMRWIAPDELDVLSYDCDVELIRATAGQREL